MSFTLTRDVLDSLRDTPLSPRDRLVLVVVAHHANKDDGRAFMGIDRLAATTGYSRRSVQYALDNLVALGWLSREVHRGGRQGTNLYRVNVQPIAHKAAPEANVQSATVNVQPVARVNVQPVAHKPVEEPVDEQEEESSSREVIAAPSMNRETALAALRKTIAETSDLWIGVKENIREHVATCETCGQHEHLDDLYRYGSADVFVHLTEYARPLIAASKAGRLVMPESRERQGALYALREKAASQFTLTVANAPEAIREKMRKRYGLRPDGGLVKVAA